MNFRATNSSGSFPSKYILNTILLNKPCFYEEIHLLEWGCPLSSSSCLQARHHGVGVDGMVAQEHSGVVAMEEQAQMLEKGRDWLSLKWLIKSFKM